MTDRLSPGPHAKDRYRALGEKEFQSFFDQIPANLMRSVAQYLPKVDGFRTTSAAGIAKQKDLLARKLAKANAVERDFHALYLIWRTWIDANIENPKAIHKLIDELEAKQAAANSSERQATLERDVDALLSHLRDESRQNRLAREQIERLFSFSPFPETAASRALIAAAKDSDDVERDAALSALPKRLQQDEDEIEKLQSGLRLLSDRVDPIVAEVSQLTKTTEKLQSAITEAKAVAEDVRDALETHTKVIRDSENEAAKAGERGNPSVDTRLEALAIAIESRRGEIRTLESKLQGIDTLLDAIAEVADAQKIAEEKQRAQSQRLVEIESALDGIRGEIGKLMPNSVINDHFSSVEDRVAALEQRPEPQPLAPTAPYETKALLLSRPESPPRWHSSLRWDHLRMQHETNAVTINSHTDLSRCLSETLQTLGLKKSAAQIFAEECAASILSKQAIFLKGGLANRTGRTLARCIGGSTSSRIAVPVGLQDGEELRTSIEQALANRNDDIGAIVVEGINRTALDIVKEVVSDCLDASFTNDPRTVVIGTVAQGPASLEIDASYLELGPIFDLDCLDWRNSPPSTAEAPKGILRAEGDATLIAQIMGASIDTDEAIRLATCFTPQRAPAIERAFARAYRSLQFVRTDLKSVTALQSLFFGWILPYWQTLGVSKEQIESELDGGKVNGVAIDQRLVVLFKALLVPSQNGGLL